MVNSLGVDFNIQCLSLHINISYIFLYIYISLFQVLLFFFWQITYFPNGYKGAGWEAACFTMKSGAQCYLQFVATLTKWEKYSFSRQGFGSTVMTISILAIKKWGSLCLWVTAMPYTIWFPERALKPLAYKHKVLSQEYAELSTSNPATEQHSDQVWEFPATQFFCGIIKKKVEER